jgi:hypothetical protein
MIFELMMIIALVSLPLLLLSREGAPGGPTTQRGR